MQIFLLASNLVAIILLLALCGLVLALSRKPGGAAAAVQPLLDELGRSEGRLRAELAAGRQEGADHARGLRQELVGSFQLLSKTSQEQMAAAGEGQRRQFADFSVRLDALRAALELAALAQREELGGSFKTFKETVAQAATTQAKQQLEGLEGFRVQVAELAKAVGEQLDKVRQENAAKLEEMRKTVDEKLHDTLEKRLGESFKQVSERLEQVHKGLGEMQTLATGVGDLKKVLSNVKTRGTWGEIQLGNLLEQMLTPDQYVIQARPKPKSQEVVEFAIKLPGRGDDDKPVLLPIDAKFPKEDYERLVEASEQGDVRGVEEAAKQLEARVKQEARDIRDKYIEPPHTTDFAILYLPIEGLYAEVLRRPGLAETLQRDYRVTIAGPTTLAALLNSLQMGFRTLAIQKRSSEVWIILAAVKKKFEAFGETFARAQKKIQEADNALELAKKDTRIMGDKLKGVESMTEAEASRVLSLPSPETDEQMN